MSKAATRRTILAGLAALPVAALPVAVSAAPVTEPDTFQQLVRAVEHARAEHDAALAERDQRLAIYRAAEPALPDELKVRRQDNTARGSLLWYFADPVTDWQGRNVEVVGRPGAFEMHVSLSRLRARGPAYNRRSAKARLYRELLPISEAYEVARSRALASSSVSEAQAALEAVHLSYWKAVDALVKARARTLTGLKVQAAEMLRLLDHEEDGLRLMGALMGDGLCRSAMAVFAEGQADG